MTLILSGTNGLSDVDGDASTPAVRGTDANTGIFFPAADTIAFAEGGVEAMRIDSSGNVGIGVTPSAWASAYKVLQIGSASSIFNTSSSTLLVTNGYIDSGFAWRYQNTSYASRYTLESGSHIWYTAPSGTAGDAITFTERMRIDSSGNVGIGTSSPGGKLDIQPGTVTTLGARASSGLIIQNGSGSANNLSQIGFGFTDSGATTNVPAAIAYVNESASSNTSGRLVFCTRSVQTDTAPTERMRITSGGDLLVGTTAAAGTIANDKPIVGGKFRSFSGSLSSIPSGTPTTMFTMTADFTTYLVTVSGLVSSISYSETAIIHLNNTGVSVTIIADGALVTIDNSGLAVRFTQNSGVTMNDMIFSVMRIM